ncbi:DUF262 domain-containing protein [Kribbella sp. CA-293567]|uniref:DUF262 domain-containing protein n=1 Tax=Kribbella sp. CA-293567 TaxID=3002436 RepID=UPI0022DD8A81|nr:DUF262 domain-containing protein [Kribbella sp. CA-293567]WBQ07825.1 DUF262 domain-containing protein [Kribbella sp. CA-293567]
MKQLEASEVPLHKVFSSDFDFSIPNYQRPYAWGTDEAMQLLDDLAHALDQDRDEPYFLGSIVLVKDPAMPAASVIDGQQRLTTLTIILAVLRDLSSDPGIAGELQDKIVEPGLRLRRLAAKPRLTLRDRERDFFQSYVQQHKGVDELIKLNNNQIETDAQKNIRDNALDLHKELQSWSSDRRDDLGALISDRTFLVVVNTPDLESAHRIFSVMNSRGLDLTPADIFKSRVIGDIPDGAADEYTEKWNEAEQKLGREDFADLFLHIRLIQTKRRSEQNLLREFPDQVLSEYLPERAKEFIDDIVVPYANAYAAITNITYKSEHGDEVVNSWFKRLAQLDTSDWQAPALWAVRTHGDDPVWLDQFLRRLERLAASMFVRRVYVTPRLARYIELLRQLDNGDGLSAEAFDLTDGEVEETHARLAGDLYLVTKTRKYVLLRLDEALAGGAGVTYDHPVITVEHVLPQSPAVTSEWRRDFTDAERSQWTHKLANLLLLSRTKNSYAQNYDFAQKKVKYFHGQGGVTTFALTSQVLAQARWTPELLKERQAALLDVLSKEWALKRTPERASR